MYILRKDIKYLKYIRNLINEITKKNYRKDDKKWTKGLNRHFSI